MDGNNCEELKILVFLLFNKYGSLVLDIYTTSIIITRSVKSLRRDIEGSRGIPVTKTGKGTGSDPVKYGIYDIASFLISQKTKTYNI